MDHATDMIPVDYGIPKNLLRILFGDGSKPQLVGVLDASKPPAVNRPSACMVTRKGVKSPLF